MPCGECCRAWHCTRHAVLLGRRRPRLAVSKTFAIQLWLSSQGMMRCPRPQLVARSVPTLSSAICESNGVGRPSSVPFLSLPWYLSSYRRPFDQSFCRSCSPCQPAPPHLRLRLRSAVQSFPSSSFSGLTPACVQGSPSSLVSSACSCWSIPAPTTTTTTTTTLAALTVCLPSQCFDGWLTRCRQPSLPPQPQPQTQ